ncbi:hypothetical protein PR003_g19534 [Phytophthora rubi]|uniref:Uncharacterized protein n=1 Tax=Phytophthora rubi TaxID=129364 RepID=A0A6A3K4M2_9STRA|nr:hypothetical protein PR002_g18397 [Phytophthora rubi]KAE9313310.1 hypothetical protein PR003_g19534 [Phytophthora rubi]
MPRYPRGESEDSVAKSNSVGHVAPELPNGHIETAELLLKTKSSYGPTGVASALEDAMSIGHFTVVRLLTRSDNPCSTTFALARAASTGDVQAAKLSVHRSDRNAVIRAACVAMGKSIALQQHLFRRKLATSTCPVMVAALRALLRYNCRFSTRRSFLLSHLTVKTWSTSRCPLVAAPVNAAAEHLPRQLE